MTTPKPNLLELAKQGDLKAIAALMNRPLQSKGITADVSAEGDCLEVRLSGETPPQQASLVQFVHKGLSNLNIPVFNRVKLLGYQQGNSTPMWEEEVPLQDLPDFLETPTPVPPMPVTQVEEEEDYAEDDASSEAYRSQADSGEYMDDQLDLDGYAGDLDLDDDLEVSSYPGGGYTDDLSLADESLEGSSEDASMGFSEEPSAPSTEDSETDSQASQLMALLRTPMAMIGAIAILLVLAGGLAYRFFFAPTAVEPEVTEVPIEAPITEGEAPEGETPADEATAPDTEAPVEPTEGAATEEATTPDTEAPTAEPAPSPEAETPVAAESPAAEPEPAPSPAVDPFREAVSKATQAAELTQTAATPQEWQQIATLWQEASDLMAEVPADSPNYATAQDRVGTYQNNAAYAQQQAQ